ncbi:ADP-ribosylation factor-like protein 15 isoform X3 [Gopherus flavomarginatus]|uniref:ADP-ribosylation factor-like protein 15 isoform X3 n=2 Tax=Gopherus flavomarginatus TaxID=286002 RepID=UPI0021CC318B|nr:ADP-ribosylation factor-like protein 15 isoform X3 [Gopherus flavomarginatus]
MDYLCFKALCCKGPPPPRPEYDLVCIGLTGSGKTSLLSQLCSESQENIVSTTGFSIKAVPFQNAILNVKELGGADTIRKYWSRYYQGSQGVIFVLDSASSEDDLETARNELHSALQHPQLCTLPFLILANHQDKPAARSVQEMKMKQMFKYMGFPRTGEFISNVTDVQSLSIQLQYEIILPSMDISKNILNLNLLHEESAGFLNPAPWMIWTQ